MKWKIIYNNDVGSNDESFWEWWTIDNDDGNEKEPKSFSTDKEADAKWLCDLLNTMENSKL